MIPVSLFGFDVPVDLALGLGSPMDLAIIAGVVVLLFGGSKIAGFGKSLGEGLKEFKKATKEEAEAPTPTATTPSSTEPTTKVE